MGKKQPKLRTYCSFKTKCDVPKYIYLNLSKHHHNIMSQLRLSILPLKLETGRFLNRVAAGSLRLFGTQFFPVSFEIFSSMSNVKFRR